MDSINRNPEGKITGRLKKRADDIELGERVIDGKTDVGIVASKVNDLELSNRAYLLVRSDKGEYTFYGCVRDAVCEPFLTRYIPEAVLQQFLFDVFLKKDVRYIPNQEETVVRCAVPTPANYVGPRLSIKPETKRIVVPEVVSSHEVKEDGEIVEKEQAEVSASVEVPVEKQQQESNLPEIDFP